MVKDLIEAPLPILKIDGGLAEILYCRCSGYRGIPMHLLLGPFNSPASAQG
jgi:hypothetical protein